MKKDCCGQPSSGDLIVSFPSKPRRPRRAVSFNLTSVVIVIAEDKSKAKAYNAEEIRRFKSNLSTDVLRLRRDLEARGGDAQNVYNWVGLERYTTPAVLERSLVSRKEHAQTVLRAQKILQEEVDNVISSEVKSDVLLRTSKRSSHSARCRATKLAAAYSTFQE